MNEIDKKKVNDYLQDAYLYIATPKIKSINTIHKIKSKDKKKAKAKAFQA